MKEVRWSVRKYITVHVLLVQGPLVPHTLHTYTHTYIHSYTHTNIKRVSNLMCIYSSLSGLDATVDGGKCRGVITHYYSQPSPSLPVTSTPSLHFNLLFCTLFSNARFYKEPQRRKILILVP